MCWRIWRYEGRNKKFKDLNSLSKSLVYLKFSNSLKYRKNAESQSLKFVMTKNGRAMLLSKCAECDSKKSKSIEEQEAFVSRA